MEAASLIVLAPIAAAVFVPLTREYADFRNEWGLGRVGALATTLLVVPALAVGLSVAHAFAHEPALQWMTAVAITVAAYSLATSALRSVAASGSPQRSS
jgi:hypothetical protein